MDKNNIRRQFPALNQAFVFMDNAGGSQTLGSVADEVRDYLLTDNVQHGASYAVSQNAVNRLKQSLEKFRLMFNARFQDELIFGASATQLTKNLSLALESSIHAGDEIILTNTEHEANSGPWKALAARRGATIKYWTVDRESFRLELDALMDLVTNKSKLIAMCQVSNILGATNPVKAVTQMAKERGIMTCIDGVAYAAHGAVDVQALGCDFYTVSLYKVFGPHIGLLFARRELMQQLPNVNHQHIPVEVSPYRFQPGGVCYELAVGAQRIVDFLNAPTLNVAQQKTQEIHWGNIAKTYQQFACDEEALTQTLLDYLSARKEVTLIGPSDIKQRVGTISFVVQGKTPESICRKVDEFAIGIRHGHFHCVQLLKDLGLFEQGGVVRVSVAHYNTEEEMDRLIAALDVALSN